MSSEDRDTPRSRRKRLGLLTIVGVAAALVVAGLLAPAAEGPGDDDRRAGAESTAPPAAAGSEGSRHRLDGADGRYRIATVREGSRVRVYDHPAGEPDALLGAESEFGSPQTLSVVGERGRWLQVVTPAQHGNPPMWVRANPEKLRFSSTDLSIHAELGERRVELRRGAEVLRTVPVTIGAEGSATPAGRFEVTDVIVGGLNPVYGCCAIVLSARQEGLPEGWAGGDRVAIHGTTGPVGNAASLGCLRATNADAAALARAVPLGTPVFIWA